jgi:uncharacterized hydrophobic protein (TIGR00271 family)
VLYLRAFATPEQTEAAVRALGELRDVRHVMRHPTADGREEMITADLPAARVDTALDALLGLGLEAADITVERSNQIGPVEQRRGEWLGHGRDSVVWAEVVEGARENARLPLRYLIFMAVAGVLAAFAVVLRNSVLIVGAMAVSPDLLPVTAACVGIVGRRPRLAGRAVGTLALGLSVAIATALSMTAILDAIGYLHLSAQALPGDTVLLPAETVTLPIIVIAFVAGIAGMLATETRASAAVGVAISVTTIPAAAYAGVSLAIGASQQALDGLAMLLANVIMLLIGGTMTLAIQRLLRSRNDRSTTTR